MRFHLALPLAALALAGSAAPAGGGDAGGPRGMLVIVHRSEDRLTSINLGTGARRTVRARWLARCAAAPYVTGGKLVIAGHRGRRAVTFALDPGLRGPRLSLDPNWLGVPSATAGRVWLIEPPRARFTSFPGVREMTVDGRVTFRTRRRVPAWNLQGAVTEGLLFEHAGRLVVWDPRAGRVAKRLPGVFVVGTHGSVVAACGSKGCRAGLRLADLSTGRSTFVRSPRGAALDFSGAFSPSGEHLAVTASAGDRTVLALVDVASGRASVVPGSRTHRFYPSPTWSPSGEWLFWNAGGGRAMAYRPGSPAAIELPFRIPLAMSMAAG